MKKIKKITLFFFVACCTLFLLFTLLIQYVFNKPVAQYIASQISSSQNSNQQVLIQQLDFNIFTRSLYILGFDLKAGNHDNPFLHFQSDTLQIHDISLFSLLFQKKFSIGNLFASNGSCRIDLDAPRPKQNNTQTRFSISNILIHHIQWNLISDDKSANFTSDFIAGVSFQIPSTNLIPSHSMHAGISDIQLTYQNRHLALDSLYLKKNNDVLDMRLGPAMFNNIADFIGFQRDTLLFPIRQIHVEKLITSVPVYYFRYLSSPHIRSFELPYIEIVKPQFLIQTGMGAAKQKRKWELKLAGHPIDYSIHKLLITDASIRTYHQHDSTPVFSIDQLKIKTLNFRSENRFHSYPFYCDALDLSGHQMQIQLNHLLGYVCNAQKITFSNALQQIRVDGLSIESTLPIDTFFVRSYFQTDKPTLKSHSLTLNHTNINHLLHSGEFFIGSILADSISIHVIRDRNFPYNLKVFPPMMQDQIKNLPFTFAVDTLLLKKGTIEYVEIPQKFDIDDAGVFRLSDVSLRMHNLANALHVLQINDTLEIHFTGKLYNQGELNVFIDMPMLDQLYTHRVYGTIGKFNAREFNKLTVPTAAIKINRGTINGGEFYFEANNRKSFGEAKLLFEKLKISMLNQSGHASKSQPDFLKSIIANVFLVHENPSPGKPPLIGKIDFERNMNRWMINFWWKSLLHGLKSIVFARENEVKEMSSSFSAYQQLRQQREAREKTDKIQIP